MSETKSISLKGLRTFLKPLMRIINKKAETWDDLKEKPFGSEWEEVKLVDNVSVTSDDQYISLNSSSPIVIGQEYTVIYDGVTYECVGYDGNGPAVIGDLSIVFGSSDGFPESIEAPFLIVSLGTETVLYFETVDSTTHTLTIITKEETIKKLDGKYVDIELPEGILTQDNYLETTAGMQKGNGEVFNNYGGNYADGYMAHAEGSGTNASGDYSHAEGQNTNATNRATHAEGYYTSANGQYSHAEGRHTMAKGESQHVQGEYNIIDDSNIYAHIVGNGTSPYISDRSNAHTLDWNGNAWYKGEVYVGGVSQDDAFAEKLVKQSELTAARNSTALIDRVNGYTYILCMNNGELTSYCAIKSIEVIVAPTKTVYMDGDIFDPTGMVAIATTYDGTTKEITNGFIHSTKGLVKGEDSIDVIYIEDGLTFTLTIPISVGTFVPATALVDFNYINNNDGTYTITSWKGTYNGEASTEMIIPNNTRIIIL